MKRRTIYMTAVLLAGTMVGTHASAQVLMRRPIPTLKDGPSVPTNPGTPTPTPTPTDPTDPQPPTQPTGRVVAYGWDASCPPNPMWGCSRVTYENDDWNYDDVDGSFCQTQQSPEAVNLAAWVGLIPGGPGVTQNQACSSSSMVYGWQAFCFSDGGKAQTCLGIERNSSVLYSVVADDSKCQSYVPDAAGTAFLNQFGLMSNAELIANPLNCGGGSEGPGGNDDNTGIGTDPETNPNDPPPDGPGWFEWEVGPWQGGGQCGQQSEMTREVRCVQHPYGGGPELPPIGAIDNGVVQVSFAGESPKLSNAVWDPSQKAQMTHAVIGPDGAGATMIKAQMVPTGDPVYVNWSYCSQALGYTPGNSYSGTEANCTYVKEKVSDGEWTNPYGGSATCSADAERKPEYTCIKQETGEEVDPAFCAENLTTGGKQDADMINVERGNYEGCTAEWQIDTYDIGCYATTSLSSGNGPVHMVESYANCIRSDGTYLDGVDAEACGERPQEGIRQQGSCVQWFNQNVYDGFCPAHPPSPLHDVNNLGGWRTVVFKGSMYAGGAQACIDSGATCCQQRFDLNTGETETVGSSQPVARLSDYYAVAPGQRGVYMDDGDGPKTEYGTNTYDGNGVLHQDSGILMRVTGLGTYCTAKIGDQGPGCNNEFFGCQTEAVGDSPQIVQCSPSTRYWTYENMHRYQTQGASGRVWVSPGVE